jgi:hypothetical protein
MQLSNNIRTRFTAQRYELRTVCMDFLCPLSAETLGYPLEVFGVLRPIMRFLDVPGPSCLNAMAWTSFELSEIVIGILWIVLRRSQFQKHPTFRI